MPRMKAASFFFRKTGRGFIETRRFHIMKITDCGGKAYGNRNCHKTCGLDL